MIDRVRASMAHWTRLVAGASPGARLVERDGVIGAVVPAAPERAVVNSVLFRDAAALEAGYDQLASAYAEIGAKWTVWVPPGDAEAGRILEARGHHLDAQPMAMGLELNGIERPPDDALPEWDSNGTAAELGAVNDRAFTFGTDSFSRAVQSFPDGAVHVYVARDEGTAVGCLAVVDHEGNSEVQMVAVVPEARGRGIAKRLLAHALADAIERGSETATLIATPMGLPVYEAFGFRPLARFSMWERADAA